METDFYWCQDNSDGSPRESPLLTGQAAGHGSAPRAYDREVDIPKRRNPFGAPPRPVADPRGSPPMHEGARNPRLARRKAAARPTPRPAPPNGGFFSAILGGLFSPDKPTDGGVKKPSRGTGPGSPRPGRRGPTAMRAVRPARRDEGGPAVESRLGERPGWSSSNSSPGRASIGMPSAASSPLRTPSLDNSPSRAPLSRADSLRRTKLFDAENRAKLMTRVEPSLRTARLRRPEGKGMVLSSLGIECLQEPCIDSLLVCTISRIAGNSPADESQQLFPGDALVEVNGKFVAHLDLEKIIMIIATAGKSVTLKVTTAHALKAAMVTLVEQRRAEMQAPGTGADAHSRARAATSAQAANSVYAGNFWEDAPNGVRRPILTSPDGNPASSPSPLAVVTPTRTAVAVAPVTAARTTPLAGASGGPAASDTGADGKATRQSETSGIHLPASRSRTKLTVLSEMKTPTRKPVAQQVADGSDGSTSTKPPEKPTEKEYGFYVRLPSETKARRRATVAESMPASPSAKSDKGGKGLLGRFFAGSSSDGAAAAAAAARGPPPERRLAPPPEEEPYVDERRISRDIISMRSSRTVPAQPKIKRHPPPRPVKDAIDVAPIDQRPAGLLTPEDMSSPPAPVLSLSEHVRVATLDNCSKVVAFLAASGLSQYIDLFEQEEIDYETLGTLTEQDLEKMGIDKLGVRRRLLRAIRQLDSGSDYNGSEISFRSSASNMYISPQMARALSDASVKLPPAPSDVSNYGSMDRPTPDGMSDNGGDGDEPASPSSVFETVPLGTPPIRPTEGQSPFNWL